MNINLFGELEPVQQSAAERANLAARFGVPPFSILDARQGYWQDRKRAWLALGIKSEIGRGGSANTTDNELLKLSGGWDGHASTVADNLTWVGGRRAPEDLDDTSRKNLAAGPRSYTTQECVNEHDISGCSGNQSGTSIFDPVLCELVYEWFSPKGGLIFDPFAGGSVRGIVAAQLGRRYVGIDLRPEQVAANADQAQAICGDLKPDWRVGDSRDIPADIAGADLIFSCPPYGNLEVYSDDPRDLSNMTYPRFFGAYLQCVAGAVERLKDNRFACFVVGDFRAQDNQGFYRNFVADTTEAFGRAGLRLYNEAILITAIGSLPLRAGKQFEASRKLGKTHQNILVYVKGDPRKATAACGAVAMEGFAA